MQPTETVAEALLGCLLVRILADGNVLSGRICETEAYLGEWDTACHTSSGKTPRNRVMYGQGGLVYVYFVYGLHHMLNVVTEKEGKGCAVLIRGVIPEQGIEYMKENRGDKMPLTDGPARLTQAFQITREHNGLDLVTSREMAIIPGYRERTSSVIRTTRIGIDYAAEKDKQALLRFVLRPGSG